MEIFNTLQIGDKIYRKASPDNIYTVTDINDENYTVELNDTNNIKIRVNASIINDSYFPIVDISHPNYYNSHPSGIECIDIARYFCFSIGNAIKYLWRAGLKKDMSLTDKQKEIEDLKKAIWYINDRIVQLQKE